MVKSVISQLEFFNDVDAQLNEQIDYDVNHLVFMRVRRGVSIPVWRRIVREGLFEAVEL